jgi:hypothetical protein
MRQQVVAGVRTDAVLEPPAVLGLELQREAMLARLGRLPFESERESCQPSAIGRHRRLLTAES